MELVWLLSMGKLKKLVFLQLKASWKECNNYRRYERKRERDVYAYAFSSQGAVQCGFCIPGMVISAKALLDINNNPTESEIKKALKGNICRCTGYVKIIKAIELAAKIL